MKKGRILQENLGSGLIGSVQSSKACTKCALHPTQRLGDIGMALAERTRGWIWFPTPCAALIWVVCLVGVTLINTCQGETQLGEEIGYIRNKMLDEISGIAASKSRPNVLWVHNDGPARHVYAISLTGAGVGQFVLPKNFEPIDCEDIAMGPGADPNSWALYLADTGDNKSERAIVRVFRFAEPPLADEQAADRDTQVLPEVQALKLTFPGGPKNVEALMVDPVERNLLLVSLQDEGAEVFTAPLSSFEPEDGEGNISKQAEASHTLNAIPLVPLIVLSGVKHITGGDISTDGARILLRSEDQGWLWERGSGETLAAVLANQAPKQLPVLAPGQDKNGEAICFLPDGASYVTLSEGKREPLFRFPLPKTADR